MPAFLHLAFPSSWSPEETHQRFLLVLQEFQERFDEMLDPIEDLHPAKPVRLGTLTPEAFDWLQLKVADFTIRGFIYGECFCPGPGPCKSNCIIERQLWLSQHTQSEELPDDPVRAAFTPGQIAWGCALAAQDKCTPTRVRTPTSETWPLAEKLGLTCADLPMFSVRLKPGDDLFNHVRATCLCSLISRMSEAERAPYLAFAESALHGKDEPYRTDEPGRLQLL